jgi:hypothetical protein
MQLIHLGSLSNLMLVKRSKVLFKGGFTDLADFVVANDLMDLSDLSAAIEALESNDHEVAEFGVTGGFLFTDEMKGFNC